MLYEEKEINLIKDFQMVGHSNVFLVGDTDEVASIAHSVLDEDNWKHWIDSSSKDAPPPDFFSDDFGLMMEVMRVDDHGFKKKGSIINPLYQREHEIEKELRKLGILDSFPNAELVVSTKTDLPTDKDHSYRNYIDNFKRTVEHHIKKISNYRNNHPHHKLIFFVFDESSAYFEIENGCTNDEISAFGKPHLFMFDKAFTDVFQKADIDYLIWFAPYKRFTKTIPPFEYPKACIYKVADALPETYYYDANHMISAEK